MRGALVAAAVLVLGTLLLPGAMSDHHPLNVSACASTCSDNTNIECSGALTLGASCSGTGTSGTIDVVGCGVDPSGPGVGIIHAHAPVGLVETFVWDCVYQFTGLYVTPNLVGPIVVLAIDTNQGNVHGTFEGVGAGSFSVFMQHF